mgnify:FL=1
MGLIEKIFGSYSKRELKRIKPILQSVLDLEELARTDILLELPTKVLCSEDCKGLCSQCGKNLNEGECSCEKKQIDPRLAILSQLLDQDQ